MRIGAMDSGATPCHIIGRPLVQATTMVSITPRPTMSCSDVTL
jgi:hypothetical protein